MHDALLMPRAGRRHAAKHSGTTVYHKALEQNSPICHAKEAALILHLGTFANDATLFDAAFVVSVVCV